MKISSSFLPLFLLVLSCTNREIPVDCAVSGLSLTSTTEASPVCNSAEGVINVSATGGGAPYEYSINDGEFQTSNKFSALAAGTFNIRVKDANKCEASLSITLASVNSNLDLIATPSPNTSCEPPDGKIEVTGKNGSPPYQFQLNDKGYGSASSFTGLNAGTYSIFIKDSKGCVKELKGVSVITTASTLAGSASATGNSSCESPNGRIEVTGKNGVPPYQYQLNDKGYGTANFFAGLNAGNYTIFIKDSKGCVNEIKGVTVPSLGSTLDGSTVLTENSNCASPNGAIKVTATGGLAPYQYQLNTDGYGASPDFSGLSEGSYTISIKDSQQCIKVITVTVAKAANNLDGSTELTPNTGCSTPNGTIKVTATGGLAPYQYQLNVGAFGSSSTFSGLTDGDYIIRVKDTRECVKELAVKVVKATLDGQLTKADDTSCSPTSNGSISVTATGGQPPYQYQLDNNGFSGTSTFSSLIPAAYSVTIKDANGCTKQLSTEVKETVSYANDIVPLLTANCNFTGCHTSGSRDFTTYDKVKAKRANIKLRTGNGTMPPSGALSQAQIALIACWVDGGGPNN